MIQTRIIPCLLKKNRALVKTIKFSGIDYIGDPINTIKIFNNFEVDELVLLDINSTIGKTPPDFRLIRQVASECFIPLTYGGGIHSIQDMKNIFQLGVEKIIICSFAFACPQFITKASQEFGSQSVIVALDIKKNIWGNYEICTHSGKNRTGIDPVFFAKEMQRRGAGEILINSIDRDGTMEGYDTNIIKKISTSVSIPVVACGGAGKLSDIKSAIHAGAAATAAGSIFVYQNTNRAVLINYPDEKEKKKLLKN